MKKLIALSAVILSNTNFIFAQSEVVENDFLRSMGKMYVVVAVILAIFIGIVAFLIYLDRKMSRLEQEIEEY